jgi:hypothetical protein
VNDKTLAFPLGSHMAAVAVRGQASISIASVGGGMCVAGREELEQLRKAIDHALVDVKVEEAVAVSAEIQGVANARKPSELHPSEALNYIAVLAHSGGLIGLPEGQTLRAIRRLTGPEWRSLAVSTQEGMSSMVSKAALAAGVLP